MKNQMINCTAFIILAGLWLAFGAAAVFHPAALDTIWKLFLGWPLIGQAALALAALPLAVGLWIWQADWPSWLRLGLVAGLALATLIMFYPKSTRNSSETTPVKA